MPSVVTAARRGRGGHAQENAESHWKFTAVQVTHGLLLSKQQRCVPSASKFAVSAFSLAESRPKCSSGRVPGTAPRAAVTDTARRPSTMGDGHRALLQCGGHRPSHSRNQRGHRRCALFWIVPHMTVRGSQLGACSRGSGLEQHLPATGSRHV